jgi:hypothetical protein
MMSDSRRRRVDAAKHPVKLPTPRRKVARKHSAPTTGKFRNPRFVETTTTANFANFDIDKVDFSAIAEKWLLARLLRWH